MLTIESNYFCSHLAIEMPQSLLLIAYIDEVLIGPEVIRVLNVKLLLVEVASYSLENVVIIEAKSAILQFYTGCGKVKRS